MLLGQIWNTHNTKKEVITMGDKIQQIANKLHILIEEEKIKEMDFLNAVDEVRIQRNWNHE